MYKYTRVKYINVINYDILVDNRCIKDKYDIYILNKIRIISDRHS